MTVSQLKQVMKFHLRNFNDEGVAISDNTVHNEVLSEDDGFTPQTSSKSVYKAAVRWSLSRSDQDDQTWPTNWMDLSVKELAPKLIVGSE